MRKFIRDFFRGFFIIVFLVVWTVFFTLQIHGGGYTYQVQEGRVKWCIILTLPGPMPFYDHYTNKIEREFRFCARWRISPWFDAGVSEPALDNPTAEM